MSTGSEKIGHKWRGRPHVARLRICGCGHVSAVLGFGSSEGPTILGCLRPSAILDFLENLDILDFLDFSGSFKIFKNSKIFKNFRSSSISQIPRIRQNVSRYHLANVPHWSYDLSKVGHKCGPVSVLAVVLDFSEVERPRFLWQCRAFFFCEPTAVGMESTSWAFYLGRFFGGF